MKALLRNTVVSFYHHTGLADRYRSKVASAGPLNRVLCFHDVPDQEWFEAVIRRLHNECNIVSPTEWKQQQFDGDQINILLTFDDGYHSWLEVAAPVLEGHSLHGLFFISDGVFRAAGDTEAESRFCREQLRIKHRALLHEAGARALIEAGHTIGGHTTDHVSFRDAPRDVIEEQLLSNKSVLEALTGHTVYDFAYPFGTPQDITRESRSLVRTAGYSYAYSAIPGFVRLEDNIPRLLIDQHQSPDTVMRWVNGAYDLYYQLKSKLV